MSQLGSSVAVPTRLGLIVPVYADAVSALELARQLTHQSPISVPLDLVFVDNGGNGDLVAQLAAQKEVTCLVESQRGPGHARSAGVRYLVQKWKGDGVSLDRCWIISLDADAVVGPEFLSDWLASIMATRVRLISAKAELQPLRGELPAPADAVLAAHWLWDFTLRCEALVGAVNVSGCNHAVRADLCESLGAYIQPIQIDSSGQAHIVAGDDWDFGLRARMRGHEVDRTSKPSCLTSSRRLAVDPVGFLTGRNYEGTFRPSSELPATAWPPAVSWEELAGVSLARLAGHFLIKPLLCGIHLRAGAEWFLTPLLCSELEYHAKAAPRFSGDWLLFRTQLIERLFQPDLVDLGLRLATQLQGIKQR